MGTQFRIGQVNAKSGWPNSAERIDDIVDEMLEAGCVVFSVNEMNRAQYRRIKSRKDVGIIAGSPNNLFPGGNWKGNGIVWDKSFFRRGWTTRIGQIIMAYKYPLHNPMMLFHAKKGGFKYKHLCVHNPTRYNATEAQREAFEEREKQWLLRQKAAAAVAGDFNNNEPWPEERAQGRVKKIADDGPDTIHINLAKLKPTGKRGVIPFKALGKSDHDACWGEVEHRSA